MQVLLMVISIQKGPQLTTYRNKNPFKVSELIQFSQCVSCIRQYSALYKM